MNNLSNAYEVGTGYQSFGGHDVKTSDRTTDTPKINAKNAGAVIAVADRVTGQGVCK